MGESEYDHYITACPPGFENLAASLHSFTILILKMNGLYSYSYLALSIKTFSTQPLQHKFVDRHVFIMYLHSVLTHTNPCMHAYDAGRIIKKFGTTQVMNSILFLFALRMFFYGHMISPWQVVLFEWIHGPIVGLFYPIMTSTAFKISPEGLTTTTTAIAYFMEGLGKCVSVYLSRFLV